MTADVCSVHGQYHFYNVRVPGAPHGRQCQCGERQVFTAPTGKGVEFSDVLVEADDLRALIAAYRGQAAMPDEGVEALCDRLELLLPEADVRG